MSEMTKGDFEVLQKNIKSVVAHGNETRKLLREAENKVNILQGIVMTQNGQIKNMNEQINALRAKIYTGGATSGN